MKKIKLVKAAYCQKLTRSKLFMKVIALTLIATTSLSASATLHDVNLTVDSKNTIPDTFLKNLDLQFRTITGKVTDDKGSPLIGVTVKVVGSATATTTDAEGNYSIEVSGNEQLEFSYVGFNSQTLSTTGKTVINLTMIANVNSLTDVVVVGYGTQKKVNLTGAVSQVDSKILEDRPIANVSQALQGAMPGLSINFNDGRPGGNGKINIRGYTSVNGGQPLVLIDGIPGDINMLNPLDVETVTVLKDASSAAIYGSRAAYGVILIVTKKGRAGKLQVTYSNNFSISNSTTSHDMMTDGYATGKLIDEAFRITTGNIYTGYTDADYDELLKRRTDPSLPSVVIQNRNGRDQYVWYGNTDWWNYFFHNNLPSMTHSLQFSGGTDKIDFLLSGRFYEK